MPRIFLLTLQHFGHPAMKKNLELYCTRLCSALCASALFGIMALTLFDVLGRKLASTSIPGALELTEMLMVIVIFAGLPLVSLRGEHVVFDSLDGYLPTAVRRWQTIVVQLACAIGLAGLAVLMWDSGAQFAQAGETSAQLKIAKYPFIYGMSLLCGITALAHLLLAFTPAESGAPAPDDAAGAAL
jgi:TRAP-type transport system small permease protein